MLASGSLQHLISTFGYWAVGFIIALESMGLPLPGEATLIAAALYAGATHELDIWLVIAAAALGAIVGDNAGYWIGRELGYRLLLNYGRYIHITEARIKLGQYLFARHGGKIVFFGRFIAVLRALAAILAGANAMSWPRFLLFNASGGIVWAAIYGGTAYYFGHELVHITKTAALGLSLAALIAVAALLFIAHRHEAELSIEAERALPGPLVKPGGKRCASRP